MRPTDRLGIDAENPRDTYLAQVIEALGGTVIDYAGSHKCCGFPIITMSKEASLKQAGTHLGDAVDAEADCLVTPCPLCHLNLDLQQPLAERAVGRELNMPVLHLPQLVGLALGLTPKEIGLQRHVVKATSVIDWSEAVVAGVGSGGTAAGRTGRRRPPSALTDSRSMRRVTAPGPRGARRARDRPRGLPHLPAPRRSKKPTATKTRCAPGSYPVVKALGEEAEAAA